MKEIEIKSLSNFVESIKRKPYDRGYTIYRGQEKDYKLLPKLFRNKIIVKDFVKTEKNMLEEFKIKAKAYLNYEPKNDYEWLAIAQHHGLNTRLLDWTENAFISLWFCVNGEINSVKSNGVVWILRLPNLSNFYVDEENDKCPFSNDSTKIYRPPYISNRIIAQSGVFTLHHYYPSYKKYASLENMKEYRGLLTKIKIPNKYFKEIKKELIIFGINSGTVFPGLDGLCELLNGILEDDEKLQKKIEELKRINSKEN